ncbi:MAG TPA: ZIP family metal transporter [Nevskiales bacterium]|nr:ZIP family metal transporter [Nevskiales bacterium]
MSLLLWVVLFSLLGGILSVTLASLLLVLPAGARRRLLPGLVSFAIGALLAAAFTGLLPRAFELAPTAVHSLGLTLLAGILLFFVLEKMVLWRHSHAGHDFQDAAVHAPHAHREATAGPLILVGDTIHNLVDGVLIGAAFLTDFHLGVLTSIAVAAHELPQELGDFAILLHAGMRPQLALALNLLTSLATVAGAVLAYLSLAQHWLPFVLALAAASFIYVAVADLIPGLHRHSTLSASLRQVALIALGVGAVLAGHLLRRQ